MLASRLSRKVANSSRTLPSRSWQHFEDETFTMKQEVSWSPYSHSISCTSYNANVIGFYRKEFAIQRDDNTETTTIYCNEDFITTWPTSPSPRYRCAIIENLNTYTRPQSNLIVLCPRLWRLPILLGPTQERNLTHAQMDQLRTVSAVILHEFLHSVSYTFIAYGRTETMGKPQTHLI